MYKLGARKTIYIALELIKQKILLNQEEFLLISTLLRD
jgi:hypothetical protein